ncbi:MAG: hypothetical protein M3454_13025 [Actinomycetota bacterium]|nr:hypothetical protein [Actinomycetota bacterium]
MKERLSANIGSFERPSVKKTARWDAQNRNGGRGGRWWIVAIAGSLWVALVVYPLSLTELREPLILLAVGSWLCLGAVLVTGRWPFAVAAASLWIVEYAAALGLSGRTDSAAPLLGVVCWLTLEIVDWQRLSAHEVRLSVGHAAVAGVLGGAAAVACLGAGLVVAGTVPVLVAVGAGAGIGVLGLAVVLARRALGADLYARTRAQRGLQ